MMRVVVMMSSGGTSKIEEGKKVQKRMEYLGLSDMQRLRGCTKAMRCFCYFLNCEYHIVYSHFHCSHTTIWRHKRNAVAYRKIYTWGIGERSRSAVAIYFSSLHSKRPVHVCFDKLRGVPASQQVSEVGWPCSSEYFFLSREMRELQLVQRERAH